jgi:hypothetical protein
MRDNQKMEIKTTKNIIEDMSELHMRNGYSIDYEPHYNKQWVSVDSMIKRLQKDILKCREHNECLYLIDILGELKGEQNGN